MPQRGYLFQRSNQKDIKEEIPGCFKGKWSTLYRRNRDDAGYEGQWIPAPVSVFL